MTKGPEDVVSAARRTIERVSAALSKTERPLTVTGAVVFLCGVVLAITGSPYAGAALTLGSIVVLIGWLGPKISRWGAKRAKRELEKIRDD